MVIRFTLISGLRAMNFFMIGILGARSVAPPHTANVRTACARPVMLKGASFLTVAPAKPAPAAEAKAPAPTVAAAAVAPFFNSVPRVIGVASGDCLSVSCSDTVTLLWETEPRINDQSL